MLSFLNINEYVKDLIPVTIGIYFDKPDEFHIDGLFSEKIFGPLTSRNRTETFSYIDLNAYVINSNGLNILLRLDKKIEKFISTEKSFKVESDGTLVIDDNGVTGISEFKKLFPKIKFRGDTPDREKFIELLTNQYNENKLFIDKLPVIPPSYRDAYKDQESNEWVIDALNDIYASIIRRAAQMKSSTDGPLFDLLNYSLQKAINDHHNYIKTKVEKKHGLIRNQMLGKRTDFSGRAVITPNPKLSAGEVGVPMRMAVSLFEPFILYVLTNSPSIDRNLLKQEIELYTGIDLTIDSILKVMKGIKNNDKIPEKLENIFFNAIELAMKDRFVLCKRDPVLHTQSYMGYKPVLHKGNTLEISTVHVAAHNSDFDGDTMAIFHPLSEESQEEIKTNILDIRGGTFSKHLNFDFTKEMLVGIYTITKDSKSKKSPVSVDTEFLENANEPYMIVKYRGNITTLGRAIYNSCFPQDFPYFNGLVTKNIINDMIQEAVKKYDQSIIRKIVTKIAQIGFKWATIMASSFTLDQFELPSEVYKIKEKLKKATPEEAEILLKEADKIVKKHITNTGFGDLVESGSSKGSKQVLQILVAKGIIADPQGNVLDPIEGSFTEGLNNKDFFNASSGARKGIIDRVINTADTGYFSRKLAFVLNPVESHPTLKDCKTKRTLTVKLTSKIIDKFDGRFYLNGSKIQEFFSSEHKLGELIEFRSPIFCESEKICWICYGKLLIRHRTPYVGILAAQGIGEIGTQMIMKCSDGLVHYQNNLVSFLDLWNSVKSDSKLIDGKETKELIGEVEGMKGIVKTLKIQKHNPTEKVLFISTKSGHTLICQSNHPLWIKKDPIHNTLLNEKCRLVGNEDYLETQNIRKSFKTKNDNLIEIEASDLKIHDAIWINNTIAINNSNSIIPEINGYFCGIYCSEGNKLSRDRQSYDFEKFKVYKKGLTYWDDEERMSKIIYGDYSYNKRLEPNFINYDKKWLSDFLAGLIDGDGNVFNNPSTCCRINTSSYYLVQQLKAICLKLGLKMNTSIVSGNKVEVKEYEQKRVNFLCDIKFINNDNKFDSIKLASVEFIPCKYTTYIPVKGFDNISVIKEIWKWEYPLYDIQTETKDYMLGFVQNHNTFHTGGSISLINRDILSDIVDGDPLSGLEK